MPAPAATVGPRSLAAELRGWGDRALVELLRARPDLAAPAPDDLTALVTRATGRASVARALDGLDRAALEVAEVLTALPEPIGIGEVGRRWGADARGPVERLRALALVWGGNRALRLVRAAADLLGPHPGGLGPPVADLLARRSPQRLLALVDDLAPGRDGEDPVTRLAAHLADPLVIEALLAEAPDGARAVLDRLLWGPPVGAVTDADRPVRTATAATPVDWLLARGLLGVADAGHVVLPREVALALRGGRVVVAPSVTAPPLRWTPRPARLVDGAAAGSAAEVVRLVEELGRSWSRQPPPQLRAGGLGVREQRRLATGLGVDDATAALLVEVAAAAALVGEDREAEPVWAPTPDFDDWQEAPVGARWARLVRGWLGSPRAASLVGTKDERGVPRQALGPGLELAAAPVVRRAVLGALVRACEQARSESDGDARAVVEEASLVEHLAWRTPRRAGPPLQHLVSTTLGEAATLGLLTGGALAGPARYLLEHLGVTARAAGTASLRDDASTHPVGEDERDADAGSALDALLPPPVDHLLLQADLTAVAPGPLRPDLARTLEEMADVESRGGAVVYRFSAETLRRALDAGRTAAQVQEFLESLASTSVPQPLRYLVEDTARRYGRVRVGSAGAYLRADDAGALDELLADRRAAGLGLRRLAPTVLVAAAGPEEVLRVVRSMGAPAAVETATGAVHVHRQPARRAPWSARFAASTRSWPPKLDDATALALVTSLRAAEAHQEAVAGAGGSADTASTASTGGIPEPPPLPGMDPATALARLREAANRQEAVWVGYAESDGRDVRRLITPLDVTGGRVSAIDRITGRLRRFPAHRVTGVAPRGDGVAGGTAGGDGVTGSPPEAIRNSLDRRGRGAVGSSDA